MSFDERDRSRMIMELRKILDILTLLHHRNKNQHRQAHWWKWLSMLKRSLQKLAHELQKENPDATRLNQRIVYMRQQLLPRCYVAFTQVVTDNQFSALGLVLVAELARGWKVFGGGGDGGEGRGGGEVDASEDGKGVTGALGRLPDDVGEVVERTPLGDVSMGSEATVAAVAVKIDQVRGSTTDGRKTKAVSPSKVIKRRKVKAGKVKKGSSVIDDLFRGLD